MNCKLLVACLMLMIVVSSVTAQCKKRFASCETAGECCTKYCRLGQCIRYGDNDNDKGPNPCQPNPCENGQCCELQVVQCFAFPCPPIARCVGN